MSPWLSRAAQGAISEPGGFRSARVIPRLQDCWDSADAGLAGRGPGASGCGRWEALLGSALVLRGPVRRPGSSARGKGRGVRGRVETHQTPCGLGSGLHAVTPPRSAGQSKPQGHASFPSLVERVSKFMGQRAGVEDQNQVHNAPYPSLEAHLVEPSFTALSHSQAVREPGGPPLSIIPSPQTCSPIAQNSPSELLPFSEKICPTSDVFHLILKSFSKERFLSFFFLF